MDPAQFHTTALGFKRVLSEFNIGSFVREWIEADRVHAPLVPALSGFMMYLFGESIFAAELILPISTFVLFLSIFRIGEYLYNRKIAYASAFLFCCFPVAIIHSRHYLLEYPQAAFFAASIWAMLTSSNFSRWKPSILFGVLAACSALSRTGGPALYAGPGIVAFVALLRQPDPLERIIKYIVSISIAAALSASWYLPNINYIYEYLHDAVYGAVSQISTAGSAHAFSLESAKMYLGSIFYEGPGFPLACAAAIALGIGAFQTKGRSLRNAPALLLCSAFVIDFIILLIAAQAVGSRYFLPVIPAVAILIIWAISTIETPRLRIGFYLFSMMMGIYHIVALTFLISVPQPRYENDSFAIRNLWFHRSIFLDHCARIDLKDPRADFHIGEVITKLQNAGVGGGASVYIMSDHPFFGPNSLQYRLRRSGIHWYVSAAPPLYYWDKDPNYIQKIFRELLANDAIIVRTGGKNYTSQKDFHDLLPLIYDPAARPFITIGEVPLDDGSRAILLQRTAAAESRPR